MVWKRTKKIETFCLYRGCGIHSGDQEQWRILTAWCLERGFSLCRCVNERHQIVESDGMFVVVDLL